MVQPPIRAHALPVQHSIAMSLGRAVPWTSWGEWAQVQTWLLSQAPEDVQRGLDRVMAWRARGRVPLGVDSTACLVEAQLRDRTAAANAAHPASAAHPAAASTLVRGSESELRLQYSMAIVRLVNGIADSSQRGRVAASVASLAASAGLPRILVDLRHEATHNELPSLAALRVAARQGLEWLRDNYWARQGAHTGAAAEKLAGLVQEYLELHTAAAAKVAASAAAAAADSEESDADEVGPSAAAAASAAASASAGRKAGGRGAGNAAMQAAGGAAAGDGSAAGRGEGYQAAEAKRRRKQLLADIRSAVPRPAAAILAQALLAASEAAEAAQVVAAAGGEGTAGISKAAPAVLERGLVAAMGHFVGLFPQLPPLLLQAAVDRLAAAGEAGDEASASFCLRWLRRLLPAAQQQQQGGMQAALGGWACSPALAQQLLATALPAQAAAAQQAACQALRGTGGGGSNGGSNASVQQQLSDVWQQAAGMLVAAAGRGGSASAAASLVALVGAAPAPASQPTAGEAQEEQAGSELAAAAARQQALLQQLERRRQPPAKRPAEQQAAASHKRWHRAEGWQACAIGALPCAADPNGRVPRLDAPAPLRLPEAFVGQQAAAAAAAAAAEEDAGGDADVQGSRQGRELRDAVAALLQEPAPAQLETGPWPAPDRFWAAAGRAEAGEAAAAEEEVGGMQSARLPLPAQVALLI